MKKQESLVFWKVGRFRVVKSFMEPNSLLDLPGFSLPRDYAERVGVVAKMNSYLSSLAEEGCEDLPKQPFEFVVPRFTGYYFRGQQPVALMNIAMVNLDRRHPIVHLPVQVDAATVGQFRIANAKAESDPPYLLIHDRHTGSCWLQRFEHGKRFLSSLEAILPTAEGHTTFES